MTREDFRVVYRRTRLSPRELPIYVRPDARFALFRADAGPVDVLVRMRHDGVLLRLIEGVVIPDVGEAIDARLAQVDVTSARRLHLALRETNGQPATEEVWLLPIRESGAKGRLVIHQDHSGRVSLIALDPEVALTIWGPRYVPLHSRVREDCTLTLTRAVIVRVRVERRAHLADTWHTAVALKPVGGDVPAVVPWYRPWLEREPPAMGQKAAEPEAVHDLSADSIPPVLPLPHEGRFAGVFAVSAPGRYEVRWRMSRHHGDKFAVAEGEAAAFDVDLRDDLEVTAVLGAANLAEARAAGRLREVDLTERRTRERR
jgi:hypothetical protein